MRGGETGFHKHTLSRALDAKLTCMNNLAVCQLTTAVKLCVICSKTEEACLREGPHIFDSITYPWAVVEATTRQPFSFHVTAKEAKKAITRYNMG
jgi:hypothetical protein